MNREDSFNDANERSLFVNSYKNIEYSIHCQQIDSLLRGEQPMFENEEMDIHYQFLLK